MWIATRDEDSEVSTETDGPERWRVGSDRERFGRAVEDAGWAGFSAPSKPNEWETRADAASETPAIVPPYSEVSLV